MPIITPAYPSMCATHNVTASTQMIMTDEFKKGGKPHYPIYPAFLFLVSASEVVERVIVGTAEWSELFKKHDFFLKYRYYLKIIASAANADLQSKWCVPSSPVRSVPEVSSDTGQVQSSRSFGSW
jgi:poly(A) polymerase